MGLLCVFVALSMIFFTSITRNMHASRASTTRERMSLGVRNAAGMMASLRNSLRAAQPNGTTPVNQELNNCLAGTMPNLCQHDQEYPVSLFSPAIGMDAAGNPLGLLPITAPKGSVVPVRFDTFGQPCLQKNPECVFRVTTSFRAQCPPPKLPATPPPPSDPSFLNYFKPMATCTIAESITITYTVEVDPAAVPNADPVLRGFSPITGTMTTSVKAVFGNDPR